MWWILFLEMSMTFLKVVKNQIVKNVNFPLKPTWRSCFFLFHLHDPKPKQNHQISNSRAKIRSTQSQTCVKYRGLYWEKYRCEHRTPKNTSQKNVQIRLIFQTLSSISPKSCVIFLQHYAWLESYDRYGSFGTMIKGSLIVSPVLWLLSSRNTLSVTHSDTASYWGEHLGRDNQLALDPLSTEKVLSMNNFLPNFLKHIFKNKLLFSHNQDSHFVIFGDSVGPKTNFSYSAKDGQKSFF